MLSKKSKKEINKLLRELTKNLDKVDRARDKLEPFWKWEIDGVVEDVIKHIVSPGKFKFFAACKFKAKVLIFSKWEIDKWDLKYKRFVSLCIKEKNFKYFEKIPPYAPYRSSSYYFPPFEAMEFENLLFQGKACLDCFAKAIGSLFVKGPPNNIDDLAKLLSAKANKNARASAVLKVIEMKEKLRGVILDPHGKNKKSIRNLITHYERIPVGFPIFTDKKGKMTTSQGAQIIMRHPEMGHLYNYSAVIIAGNVWYYTTEILKRSFQALFSDEIKAGYLKKVEELKNKKAL